LLRAHATGPQLLSKFPGDDSRTLHSHALGINDAIIENMLSWHHSGFHVYVGSRIWPDDQTGLENLARYIVRACFSQQRMVYIPVEKSADGVAKVIYASKDGRVKKTFDALARTTIVVLNVFLD
jgi:hypothetical protein